AYAAGSFNNIMDMLQMVFGFVNAPLLATFLLGMFWRRATGHGAFLGLLAGTLAATLHHGLTLSKDALAEAARQLQVILPAQYSDIPNAVFQKAAGIKGGWLAGGHPLHIYPVDMAQNFWA